MALINVDAALRVITAGRPVIIVDDEDRENEGDFCVAAEHVSAEMVNFFATHGRGLICCAMAPELIDRFALPLMVAPEENRSGFGTAFTLSVEAARGVTTGISAADRARTIGTLVDPRSGPDDLVKPGHMFPLRAHADGVLGRDGQTEASVDLARLAGLRPAAMICEVMNDDGSMARLPDLERVSARFDIPIVSVEAVRRYREEHHDVALAATVQCA